jgi:hypothetical protein
VKSGSETKDANGVSTLDVSVSRDITNCFDPENFDPMRSGDVAQVTYFLGKEELQLEEAEDGNAAKVPPPQISLKEKYAGLYTKE